MLNEKGPINETGKIEFARQLLLAKANNDCYSAHDALKEAGVLFPLQNTTDDRLNILCEKWQPRYGCYRITLTNEIYNYKESWNWSGYSCCKHGDVFAPSRELAEEIVNIRKGEWSPKNGDLIYSLSKDDLKDKSQYDGTIVSDIHHLTPEQFHYFPSEAQKNTFKQNSQFSGMLSPIVEPFLMEYEKRCAAMEKKIIDAYGVPKDKKIRGSSFSVIAFLGENTKMENEFTNLPQELQPLFQFNKNDDSVIKTALMDFLPPGRNYEIKISITEVWR